MGIKQKTPMSEIRRHMLSEAKEVEREIIRRFAYVGERCLSEARDRGNYTDRTGNLRSSIGYVIVKDGEIIKRDGFRRVKDGKDGVQEGKAFINKLVSEFPSGIALIVVAGMDYAGYVEARNFNVLTSSELLAEQLVPEIMAKLGFVRK